MKPALAKAVLIDELVRLAHLQKEAERRNDDDTARRRQGNRLSVQVALFRLDHPAKAH